MSAVGLKRAGLAVALCAALVPAAPATALDIAYREASGVVEEGTQDGEAASCPAEMSVASGGAWAGGGFETVVLNSTYPSGDSSWSTYYDSHGGDVLFRSHVVCINRDALIRTVEATLSNNYTGRFRRCPKERRTVTGGGIYSGGSFGQTDVWISSFYSPLASARKPNAWFGALTNTTEPLVANLPWSVYVVCHGELDVRYVTERALLRPGRHKTLAVRCRDDEQVLGGGGQAPPEGSGEVGLHLRGSFPFDSKTDANDRPDDGWKVVAESDATQKDLIFNDAVCVKA